MPSHASWLFGCEGNQVFGIFPPPVGYFLGQEETVCNYCLTKKSKGELWELWSDRQYENEELDRRHERVVFT